MKYFKSQTKFTPSITLCKIDSCTNPVQASSFSESSSPYCAKCISKFEATRLENEKLASRNKQTGRQTAVEIPVQFETSRTSRSTANEPSAYNSNNMPNMVPNSKLYKTNSLLRPVNTRTESTTDDDYFSSTRYRPSVPLDNKYYNSPSYLGTKEMCIYCKTIYLNIDNRRNSGYCDNCEIRYGKRTFR